MHSISPESEDKIRPRDSHDETHKADKVRTMSSDLIENFNFQSSAD